MIKVISKFKQIINTVRKIALEVIIPNKSIRKIIRGNIVKSYLKKYVKIVNKQAKNEITNEEIKDYTIWQFWDSELNLAPSIVKKCINSVEKFKDNKKHIVLNMKNVEDYVEIPSKYYDLLKSKKILKAHFSDILRLKLLITHGGLWADATIYLTDKIPNYITNSDLFLFQNYENIDIDRLNIANYFIHSKPNNKILKDTLDIINEYWKDNDYLMNYFLNLYALTLATKMDTANKNLWHQVPFASLFPVQRLQEELKDEFNALKWEAIKQNSFVHKLSYKEKVLKLNSTKNSFYEKLINGELV